MHRRGFYEKYVKRPQDLLCALVAVVLLSPVMAVIAILIRIKLGSPVFFIQNRPGLDGKVFKLYKFRSMADRKDKNGEFLPDEVRLTKFGQKLRGLSLDELPEIFNILKGDMSIVGPRPLLVEYLPLYNRVQARRQEVRPGLTGLAQVHGRNAVSWEERLNWDVEYVDHISFLGDWRIILKTVWTVLSREGISSGTSVTMEKFKGSQYEGIDINK
ncbi:MAG: sugar transferase [Lachnospiraceae bacterium]|nr:sugar transferase [Lachnospiraceae bacterium]